MESKSVAEDTTLLRKRRKLNTKSPAFSETHTACHRMDERSTRSKTGPQRHPSDPSQQELTNPSLDIQFATSETVAAVRALIAQGKMARKVKDQSHKRGEYHRYSPEVREAIALHALRHGTHDAARVYSESLGEIPSILTDFVMKIECH